MTSQRTRHEFTQITRALGIDPIDAAKHIMDEVAHGAQHPRWMRRVALTIITRRASNAGGSHV